MVVVVELAVVVRGGKLPAVGSERDAPVMTKGETPVCQYVFRRRGRRVLKIEVGTARRFGPSRLVLPEAAGSPRKYWVGEKEPELPGKPHGTKVFSQLTNSMPLYGHT